MVTGWPENPKEIKLPTLTCLRCTFTWIPRGNKLPKFCPRCKNPNWNKPQRLTIAVKLMELRNRGEKEYYKKIGDEKEK